MSDNPFLNNRMSTPATSNGGSSLRPPPMRSSLGPGMHQSHRSSDMGHFNAAPVSRTIRPASEIFYNPQLQSPGLGSHEESNQAAQQWIADIDQYQMTLEEMAAATLDQEFKDELTAIEQWFQVLSEPERTAALYALLQHTTQLQIRFFNGVLQQMAESHPAAGLLSTPNFGGEKDNTKRMSTFVGKTPADTNRNTVGGGRSMGSANKRNSVLDLDEINSMFPDAAAAIAKQKADFSQQQQTGTTTNKRASMMFDSRTSLLGSNLGTSMDDKKDPFSPRPPPSPWGSRVSDTQVPINRPKSTTGQQPMGQFSQPSPSAPQRSPRPMTLAGGDTSLHATTLGTDPNTGLPILSPFPLGASWASMSNTPMVSSFQTQQNQADLVANANAMKLAALSTVNNRLTLDDPRKYRRARSSDDQPKTQSLSAATMPSANFIMTNELGQVLTPQQAAALQAQQLAAMTNRSSRPNSPGIALQGAGLQGFTMGGGGVQSNGFLSAYDGGNPNLLNIGMAGLNLNLGHYGGGIGQNEGYLSDASEINRGRSPRGKRGSSRPPEDPTDIELLKDIPGWLRGLRLHKYTDNLKDMAWQDLVLLDDEGLEKKGVSAVGARRKMIKVFEQVREAQAAGKA